MEDLQCANCGRAILPGGAYFAGSMEDEACCSKWCENEHADRGCPHEMMGDYRTADWYRREGLPFLGD